MDPARARIPVLLVLLLAALPGTAFAQSAVVSPSAGAMAAIALEQAGYRAQADVLSDLGILLDRYALLVWALCAATAFTIAAVHGAFEKVIWLLIGPALFLLMIRTTDIGRATEWRVMPAGAASAVQASPGLEVSWFFNKYNNFISAISRQLIQTLTNTESLKIKEKFFNRGEVMSALLGTEIKDSGLNSFLREGSFQCHQVLAAAQEVAIGNRDINFRGSPNYQLAKSNYDQFFPRKDKKLQNTVAKRYLVDLFSAAQTGGGQFPTIGKGRTAAAGSGSLLDGCGQRALQRISNEGGVESMVNGVHSCEELWCWMGLGVQWEVARANDEQRKRSGIRQSTYQEILDEVAVKAAEPKVTAVAGSPLAATPQVQPDTSVIPVIIFGYLMRERLRDDQLGADVMSMMKGAGYNQQKFAFDPKTMTEEQIKWVTQKYSQEIIAEVKKFEVIQFMLMIPYLQGFILYVLALAFPFFALYLIIPGKASNFVTWMMLWAWAKCWDVGWALVMIVDDFLWQFMPHSAKFDPSIDPNFTPATAFEVIFRNDPSYSLATYYIILAALTSAVPMFSAQIMLGAKAGLVTPMVKGVSNFASQFSMPVTHYVASKQALGNIQLREGWIEKELGQYSELSAEEKINSLTRPENRAIAQRSLGNIKKMRALANELRSMPAGSSVAGLSFLNPTAQGIEKLAPMDAALAADRIANSMEANYHANMTSLRSTELNYTNEAAAFYQINGVITGRDGGWWETFGNQIDAVKTLETDTRMTDIITKGIKAEVGQKQTTGVLR